jgi:hypothetical protein
MLQVQVNDERLEAGVLEMAAELQLSADSVVKQALEQMLEDRIDYVAGVRALKSMKYTISSDEMERRSELAD